MDNTSQARGQRPRPKSEPRDFDTPRSRWSASTISTAAPSFAQRSDTGSSYDTTEIDRPSITKPGHASVPLSGLGPSVTRSSSQQTSGSIPIILQLDDQPPPLPPLPREASRLTLKEPRLTPRRHPPAALQSLQDATDLKEVPSSAFLRSKFFTEDKHLQAKSAGSSKLPTPVASPPQKSSGSPTPARQDPGRIIQASPESNVPTNTSITSKAKSLVSKMGTIRSSTRQSAYQRLQDETTGDIALTSILKSAPNKEHALSAQERQSLRSSYDFVPLSRRVPTDPEQNMLEAKGHLTGGLGSGMDHVLLETKLRMPTDDFASRGQYTPQSPSAGKLMPSLRHPRSLMPGRPPPLPSSAGQEAAEKTGQIVAIDETVEVDISNLEGPQAGVTNASNLDRLTEKVQQSYYFPPDPQMPDWRPFPLRLWYTLTLISIAIILAGLQEYFCQRSQNSEHHDLLEFKQAKELGEGDFFVWKYLPTILMVLYGVMWLAKDFEVKRLEPYYQLSNASGAVAAESLNLDYLTFWSYLVPLKAIRYKQWAVALSSLATLLSSALVPVLQSASLNMKRGPDGLKMIVVDPAWSRLLEATFAVIALLGLYLIVFSWRKSGLLSDPKGIAGIAAMANRSHILNDFSGLDTADEKAIRKQLRHRRYILHKSSLWQGEYIQAESQTEHSEAIKARSPHPFILQLKVGVPYLGLLLLFLALLPVFMFTSANIVVVKAPWLLTLVATLLKLAWSNLETNVRLIEPFYRLSLRHAAPSILTTDYTGTVPGLMPVKATLNGHYLLAAVGFCSILTEVMTVCVSSLNVNGRDFSPDSRTHDSGPITSSGETIKSFWISLGFAMAIPLVLILTAGIVYLRRRHPFLPRLPGTIASVLAFIHQSRMLYDFVSPEDEHEVDGKRIEELDAVAMTKHLESRGKTYGLGWYKGRDGRDHLGIDEEELLSAYRYGVDWRRGRMGGADIGTWDVY